MYNTVIYLRRAVQTVCLFMLCSHTAIAEVKKVYSFGVVPQQSAKRLAQLWTPLLQHLSEQTGITIQFRTAKNIPTFEQRLKKGEYDFAYMNPYHYTVFSSRDSDDSSGYVAMAKRIDQKIQGIVVAKKDTDATELNQLEGKKLAFPSPAAFAATLLPQAELRSQSIAIMPKYVSSHDSVYLSVAKGLFAAGGGVKRTLNNIDPQIRDQLNIIWMSEAYTPHAFAAKMTVPDDIRQKVTEGLVSLSQTEKGQSLLQGLKIKHGITAADDSDWDDVRSLNIDAINF